MTAQQSDDSAYQTAMQHNAAAMYPADPQDFRSTWAAASVPWIRETVERLGDDQLVQLAQMLRAALLTGKADLTEIWQLAALQAGVL